VRAPALERTQSYVGASGLGFISRRGQRSLKLSREPTTVSRSVSGERLLFRSAAGAREGERLGCRDSPHHNVRSIAFSHAAYVFDARRALVRGRSLSALTRSSVRTRFRPESTVRLAAFSAAVVISA
jgi:hypothetical protein